MDSTTEFLTADHHDCDALWLEVENSADSGAPGALRANFGRFEAAMERHFTFEEGALFPAFEEATGMYQGGPTFVMRAEHVQMRRVLQTMRGAAERGDVAGLLEFGDALLMLIQQHNVKEERMLYPACDAHLGGAWAALRARFPPLP